MNICVFCGSSNSALAPYTDAVHELARKMGEMKMDLVYGGASIGIMGELAKSVVENGSKVIGVIPKALEDVEIAFKDASELIVTFDMAERKNIMEARSDGFLCLPGGFGTLEEILEMITLKQLRYINKPIVFLNLNGYFDHFFDFIDEAINSGFIKNDVNRLYFVTDDVENALAMIKDYDYSNQVSIKW